jgi:vacuolar-type H+-ATPase subunit I/STV1
MQGAAGNDTGCSHKIRTESTKRVAQLEREKQTLDTEKTNIAKTLGDELTASQNKIVEEKKKTEGFKQQLEETKGKISLNCCY